MTHGMAIKEIPSSVRRQRAFSKNCVIMSVIGMTVSSFVLFVVFWCTSIYQNTILSTLTVTTDSAMYELFRRPPIRAVYRIRIFNYTNVEDFESGKSKKLRVEEAGPYIYRETVTRVNQVFHPNGSLSFQEERSFEWEGGSPDTETIIVPNVPLFATMAFLRDLNFVAQLAITGVLSTFQTKTFIPLTAGGFLWGYDDRIFDLAKKFSWQENLPFDKFGLLAYKTNVSKDVITIHTGANDLRKLAMIERINGATSRHAWNDKKCDAIHGTEGFMFPAGTFDTLYNASVDVYSIDMCRTISLYSQGSGSSFGMPTRTFKPSPHVFTATVDKDYCYCPETIPGVKASRKCPPAGIFNGSACNFNMPLLGSFPHYFAGDKSLLKNIEGLNPQAELHESVLELHPRLGVLVGGQTRIQMNVEARRAIGVPYLGNLDDGQILPLIWIEVAVDDIPEPLLGMLKHAVFTANFIEGACQWGSVFGMVFSLCFLAYLLQTEHKKRLATLKRNSSGQNQLLEHSDNGNV
uniref:Scavenger receptor class B member 1 n=1 Tax=Aulacocentrum confusum TaxID=2767324 RepID=A0A7G8Z9J4_9HYME|nr:sensory neuron membrane protein 3 [Aulacocentrum confusum]